MKKKSKKTVTVIATEQNACKRCEKLTSAKLHSCPLAEVFGNKKAVCNCCEKCTENCFDAV